VQDPIVVSTPLSAQRHASAVMISHAEHQGKKAVDGEHVCVPASHSRTELLSAARFKLRPRKRRLKPSASLGGSKGRGGREVGDIVGMLQWCVLREELRKPVVRLDASLRSTWPTSTLRV